METRVLEVDSIEKDYNNIIEAARVIKAGDVVAIPTETVYGLAGSIFNEEAIKKIFIAKGRPQDNPLIAHISSIEQVDEICSEVPEKAKELAKKFWPGPLTIILKRKSCVSDTVTAGLDTVAVRFPSHPVANAIIKEVGEPLVAPSANLSGKPSTTSAKHCVKDLNGRVPLIIDGGDCEFGLESTIIDATSDPMVILRLGAIPVEELLEVVPNLVYEEELTKTGENEIPKAPGMKYRHYAPNAPVTVVTGEPYKTAEWIANNSNKDDGIICFEEYASLFTEHNFVLNFGSYSNLQSNANRLFRLLREFDETDVKKIFVQCPMNKKIGKAIINRLQKAAGGNIIEIDN